MSIQTYGVFIQDAEQKIFLLETRDSLVNAQKVAEDLRTTDFEHAFVIPLAYHLPIAAERGLIRKTDWKERQA